MTARLSRAAREVLLGLYAEALAGVDLGGARADRLLAARRGVEELRELADIAAAALAAPARRFQTTIGEKATPALASGVQAADVLPVPRADPGARRGRVVASDHDLPENRLLREALRAGLERLEIAGDEVDAAGGAADTAFALRRALAHRALREVAEPDDHEEDLAAASDRLARGDVRRPEPYERLLAWLRGTRAASSGWPADDDRLDAQLFAWWVADEAVDALDAALGPPTRSAAAPAVEAAGWEAPDEVFGISVSRRAPASPGTRNADRVLPERLAPAATVRVQTRLSPVIDRTLIVESALPVRDALDDAEAAAAARALGARALTAVDGDAAVAVFGDAARHEMPLQGGRRLVVLGCDPAAADGADAWRAAVRELVLDPAGVPGVEAAVEAGDDHDEQRIARSTAVAVATLRRELERGDPGPARKLLRTVLGDAHDAYDPVAREMLTAAEHVALALGPDIDHSGAVLGLFAAVERQLQASVLEPARETSNAVVVSLALGPMLAWIGAAARRAAGAEDAEAASRRLGRRQLDRAGEAALAALADVVAPFDLDATVRALDALADPASRGLRNRAAHGSRTLGEDDWRRAHRLVLGPLDAAPGGWLGTIVEATR